MKQHNSNNFVRESILDATDKLLALSGYQKMTIDDLAKEAGIGKGSVYLHFESKEEVVLSHIDRIIERMGARLKQIAASELTAASRIREMIITRVLFRFDSVQHYSQSLDELLRAVRPNLLLRRRKYFENEAEIFARVLEAGNASHEFDVGDSKHTARLILVATNSLLPYSLSAKDLGDRKSIESQATELAMLMLSGLLRR